MYSTYHAEQNVIEITKNYYTSYFFSYLDSSLINKKLIPLPLH